MAEPSLADQKVAIGASSAQSAAFSAKTNAVMVAADAVCSIAFGANPAATASNFRLPANGNPVVFAVVPGTKVAVITNT